MEGEDRLSDPIPICEKEEEEQVKDGESLSSTTTGGAESCNIKPLRPPVPPKPPKSKETSLGQILVVPLPEVLPCEDQNQSFKTDDEPAGDNLVALESPSSISESFHLSQHTNNPASGDESAGNPSQVSVIVEADSKNLSPNSIAEAINQGHLITAAPSNSTDTNVPTVPAPATITKSDCPFSKLHHQTPSEFLSYPEILEQNDKSILFGIDDFSSKVETKIGFIVQNLKDCGGIWPIMFLEKLNKIIVRCELSPLQLYFHENSGILSKLLESFDQERRCSMVFRYWCTFYNILAREVVPSSTLASTSLLSLLQRDFILASTEVCRCSEGTAVAAAAGAVSKENSQYSDDQHPIIEFEKQLEILAILMIPLMTARAETKYMKTSSCPDLDTHRPDPITFTKAIMSGMSLIITNAEVDMYKASLKTLNTEESQKPVENSNLLLDSMKSVASITSAKKGTLINLLMAYNLEFAEEEYNPVADVIVKDECHRKFIINYAIAALKIELKLMKRGNFHGLVSMFPPVVGLQIMGIRGPMKLLISILKHDDTLFGMECVQMLFCISQAIRETLTQEEAKCDLDETAISQITKESLQFDALLETRNTYIRLQHGSPIGSTSSKMSLGGSGDWKMPLSRRPSISSFTGSISSHSEESEGKTSTITLSWAIGDALKNCFGCAKSKKKLQTTVRPATKEDIEECKYLTE